MNPYGGQGPGQMGQSADAYMFPGWGSVQSGYQGSSPYGPQGKPSFFGAVNQLASPLSKDPYWGNPVDNNSTAYQSIGTKPFDAAAWIGQRIAMPALTFGMTQGIFSGAGRTIGQGLGQGLFGSGMVGSTIGRGMGFLGSFGLPLAMGSAAAHAVDSAVFQPYIRTRQMTEEVMRNFSGVSFGGSVGNPISGRGLNASSAASISRGIDSAGINDMTFSANQMHSISGMGMRAGLFDDVGSGGILSRAKDIAAQVKLLVSISKDPNIQTAIEQLSQLRAGGASISGGVNSQASRAFSQMGYQASQAGVSVQQLMAASSQGQYMFQANGMTPYLGAMAAGNAYAGFSAAFRSGNLSPALLARMGGLQGATNSALGAQITAGQTPYNQMSLYNQAFGGASAGGSFTGVAQRFGALASSNPLQAAGGMLLYGTAMQSKQSREGGSRDMENQAISLLQSHSIQPSGGGGKYSPEQIATAWQNMGMSPDQIRAASALRASETDSSTIGSRIAAVNAQGKEQMLQYITQEGLYNGVVGRASTSLRKMGQGIQSSVASNVVYPVTDAVGGAVDAVGGFVSDMMYGNTMPSNRPDFSSGKRINYGDADRSSTMTGLYDRLNREAGQNTPLGEQARKILNGQKDSKSLAKFAKDAGMTDVSDQLENGPDLYNQFSKDVSNPKMTYGDSDGPGKKPLTFQIGNYDMTDSMTVAKQARAVILDAEANGLSLGTDMDQLLSRGNYGKLREQLASYSPANKAGAVKYDATYASKYGYNDKTGKLDGLSHGVNIDFNRSQHDIAGMITRSMQTNEEAQKVLDNAQTGGDWGSFTKTMGVFDSAVKDFATAVSNMPGAKQTEKPSAESRSIFDDWRDAGRKKLQSAGD